MNCINVINFSRLYYTLNVYFPMHYALIKVILSFENLIHTSFLHDDTLPCITFGSLENSSICLTVNFIPASKLILFCCVCVICFERNCSLLYCIGIYIFEFVLMDKIFTIETGDQSPCTFFFFLLAVQSL